MEALKRRCSLFIYSVLMLGLLWSGSEVVDLGRHNLGNLYYIKGVFWAEPMLVRAGKKIFLTSRYRRSDLRVKQIGLDLGIAPATAQAGVLIPAADPLMRLLQDDPLASAFRLTSKKFPIDSQLPFSLSTWTLRHPLLRLHLTHALDILLASDLISGYRREQLADFLRWSRLNNEHILSIPATQEEKDFEQNFKSLIVEEKDPCLSDVEVPLLGGRGALALSWKAWVSHPNYEEAFGCGGEDQESLVIAFLSRAKDPRVASARMGWISEAIIAPPELTLSFEASSIGRSTVLSVYIFDTRERQTLAEKQLRVEPGWQTFEVRSSSEVEAEIEIVFLLWQVDTVKIRSLQLKKSHI